MADYIDNVSRDRAQPHWPTPYKYRPSIEIQPRRWVYGNNYLRSFVSVMASAGGVGKTSLLIVEALAIVTGRPLLGEPVQERSNVWLVNLEDPLEEIDRRITAAMQYYGIKPEEIEGRLFVNAGRDFTMKFGAQTRYGVVPNTALVKSLIEEIPKANLGVVFIDPWICAHSVNESDNGSINAVIAEIRKVADETNCAVVLVHHIRKGNGQDASIDSVRGASSLIGAARTARVLNRISVAEASRLGLSKEDECTVFRVTDGKSNLAPASGAMVYRRMLGVKLNNGEWIGVCAPFLPPDQPLSLTDDEVRNIQKIVFDAQTNGQPFRQSSQANNWIGSAVARLLDINLTEPRGKARVSGIVKALLDSAALTTERKLNTRQGREIPVVCVGNWVKHDEA